MTACSSIQTRTTEDRGSERVSSQQGILNTFNPQAQLTLSGNIHSVVLQRSDTPGSAPIIELTGNRQLELIFETLGFDSRQLQITFSHYNPDWSTSGIPPEQFLTGFQLANLSGGTLSRNTRTNYRQFHYRFPNSQIRFNLSGNYMLWVIDADTGNLLFTAPFFISENIGSVTSSIDVIQTPRQQLRTSHIPRTRYQITDSVVQPQFDLSFRIVQNQFWGRAIDPDETDFSSPDHVLFEASRNQAFVGDYEFRILQFREISQTEPQINSVDFSESMPIIYLMDDSVGDNISPFGSFENQRTGASQNLNADYATAWFRLDHQQTPDEESEIFLVGDFNRWAIQSQNRLSYNSEIQRWETSVIIKPGNYHYKYVVLENNQIDDLAFDDRFLFTEQQYHSFIYMRDITRNYYRLLQTANFFSRNSD